MASFEGTQLTTSFPGLFHLLVLLIAHPRDICAVLISDGSKLLTKEPSEGSLLAAVCSKFVRFTVKSHDSREPAVRSVPLGSAESHGVDCRVEGPLETQREAGRQEVRAYGVGASW